MTTFKFVIRDEEGLHARPARLLVKEAGKLDSVILIDKDGQKGNAKKIFAVMGLGVKKGEEVTVIVEGETEENDSRVIRQFFEENL